MNRRSFLRGLMAVPIAGLALHETVISVVGSWDGGTLTWRLEDRSVVPSALLPEIDAFLAGRTVRFVGIDSDKGTYEFVMGDVARDGDAPPMSSRACRGIFPAAHDPSVGAGADTSPRAERVGRRAERDADATTRCNATTEHNATMGANATDAGGGGRVQSRDGERTLMAGRSWARSAALRAAHGLPDRERPARSCRPERERRTSSPVLTQHSGAHGDEILRCAQDDRGVALDPSVRADADTSPAMTPGRDA